MMERTTFTLSLFLFAFVACGQQRADGPSSRNADGGKVVAESDGITVTLDELDRRAAGQLVPIRQQEYEARRQALDAILMDKLFAREASRRGITVDELLKAEVDGKSEAPRAAEIESVYEQNRSRVGGRSLEQMRPEIERLIVDHGRGQRRQAFSKELSDKANLRIRLQAPRFEVKLPPSSPVRGPANAPVTIVEFADFQCPYCKRAEQTLDDVLARYPGKVRFIHGDLPIDGHPGAFPASRAARCAGEQGKFWEYRKDLLVRQSDFNETDLKSRAETLGLDSAPFASCLASGRHDGAIREALNEATKLGVSSTPTFFVNGRMILGAKQADAFHEVIGEELAGPR